MFTLMSPFSKSSTVCLMEICHEFSHHKKLPTLIKMHNNYPVVTFSIAVQGFLSKIKPLYEEESVLRLYLELVQDAMSPHAKHSE